MIAMDTDFPSQMRPSNIFYGLFAFSGPANVLSGRLSLACRPHCVRSPYVTACQNEDARILAATESTLI